MQLDGSGRDSVPRGTKGGRNYGGLLRGLRAVAEWVRREYGWNGMQPCDLRRETNLVRSRSRAAAWGWSDRPTT